MSAKQKAAHLPRRIGVDGPPISRGRLVVKFKAKKRAALGALYCGIPRALGITTKEEETKALAVGVGTLAFLVGHVSLVGY